MKICMTILMQICILSLQFLCADNLIISITAGEAIAEYDAIRIGSDGRYYKLQTNGDPYYVDAVALETLAVDELGSAIVTGIFYWSAAGIATNGSHVYAQVSNSTLIVNQGTPAADAIYIGKIINEPGSDAFGQVLMDRSIRTLPLSSWYPITTTNIAGHRLYDALVDSKDTTLSASVVIPQGFGNVGYGFTSGPIVRKLAVVLTYTTTATSGFAVYNCKISITQRNQVYQSTGTLVSESAKTLPAANAANERERVLAGCDLDLTANGINVIPGALVNYELTRDVDHASDTLSGTVLVESMELLL